MKKIGILFGMENSFPPAFIERVNEIARREGIAVEAEQVTVDKVQQGHPTEYTVIVDRISQDVPFYRAYLKNAAICGTAVINNPFWWSADEKFFNNALAVHVGVPVPRTVLLPSKDRPDDTSSNSFRNLKFPLSWEGIFEHIGFPAFMKPHSGGGWKSVYPLANKEEFFKAYSETGQLVMMFQEAIEFDDYFRCYCLGRERVHIMQYEPRNPHHLRYKSNNPPPTAEMLALVKKYVLALNDALGYDFNTVEFAIRDGIPYAIDFCNPAPDAEISSVGQENFDWIVENAARYAIDRALNHKEGQMNLTWGTFMQNSVAGLGMENVNAPTVAAVETKKASAPKVAAAKNNETKKDDLTKIEGIGPKIAGLLTEAGISTFSDLAKAKTTKVKEILEAAGSRYKMHDPTTWGKQAKLAADGKWDDLKKLQDELMGGK
jgi:predicted flap endonuclease-1-like 5' DNA nuclease